MYYNYIRVRWDICCKLFQIVLPYRKNWKLELEIYFNSFIYQCWRCTGWKLQAASFVWVLYHSSSLFTQIQMVSYSLLLSSYTGFYSASAIFREFLKQNKWKMKLFSFLWQHPWSISHLKDNHRSMLSLKCIIINFSCKQSWSKKFLKWCFTFIRTSCKFIIWC